MEGSKCDLACDDVADEDENEEYQPVRRRQRVTEPVASPVMSMSEHDDTVMGFCFSVSSFLGRCSLCSCMSIFMFGNRVAYEARGCIYDKT